MTRRDALQHQCRSGAAVTARQLLMALVMDAIQSSVGRKVLLSAASGVPGLHRCRLSGCAVVPWEGTVQAVPQMLGQGFAPCIV